MQILIVELWEHVLDNMSINDILRLSRTCWLMRNIVEGYWRTAFNFSTLMQPFIRPETLYCFRQMLQATGAIISGSTALQFLDRARYDDSDLDIFVNHLKCDIVSKWLLNQGMKRVKNISQPTPDGIDDVDGYNGSGETHHVEEYEVTYSELPRRIQLIATSSDPVIAVLNFHSSCVMNFITHSKVFSLYPYSTFCDRRSIVWNSVDTSEEWMAADKYLQRGWRVERLMFLYDMMNRPAELGVRKRWPGDSLCWSFDLPTADRLDEMHEPKGGEELLSWRLKYSTMEYLIEQEGHHLMDHAFTVKVVTDEAWMYDH